MQHKKQLYNLVESICSLNQNQWNNLRGDFDPAKSAALLIEESLELIGDLSAREHARDFVSASLDSSGLFATMDSASQLDALIDTLYITIGELHKFGCTPENIVDALQIVHNSNLQKSGEKDSEGKVVKPDDFQPPEPALAELIKKAGI